MSGPLDLPFGEPVAVGRVDALHSNRVRRYAPRSSGWARLKGRIIPQVGGLGSEPDDGVRGVGELHSIRVRRCAPRIGQLGEWGRGRMTAAGWGFGFEPDDSVFGVVELQSVPGVGGLRCAGR
jgi:hypothetical protein